MTEEERRGYLRGVQDAAAQIAKAAEGLRQVSARLRADNPLRHKKLDVADHFEQAANVALSTPYVLGKVQDRRCGPRPARVTELAKVRDLNVTVLSPARRRDDA